MLTETPLSIVVWLGYMTVVILVLRNLHTDVHNGCISLHLHHMCMYICVYVYVGSFFQTSLPAFAVDCFHNDKHSEWGEVEMHAFFISGVSLTKALIKF